MIFPWSIMFISSIQSDPSLDPQTRIHSPASPPLTPLFLKVKPGFSHLGEPGMLHLLWKAPSCPTYWLMSTYPLGRISPRSVIKILPLGLTPQKGPH